MFGSCSATRSPGRSRPRPGSPPPGPTPGRLTVGHPTTVEDRDRLVRCGARGSLRMTARMKPWPHTSYQAVRTGVQAQLLVPRASTAFGPERDLRPFRWSRDRSSVRNVTKASRTAQDPGPNLAERVGYLSRWRPARRRWTTRSRGGLRSPAAIELYADARRQLRRIRPAGRCSSAAARRCSGCGSRSARRVIGPRSTCSPSPASGARWPGAARPPGARRRQTSGRCSRRCRTGTRTAARSSQARFRRPAHAPAGRRHGRGRDAGGHRQRSRVSPGGGDPHTWSRRGDSIRRRRREIQSLAETARWTREARQPRQGRRAGARLPGRGVAGDRAASAA